MPGAYPLHHPVNGFTGSRTGTVADRDITKNENPALILSFGKHALETKLLYPHLSWKSKSRVTLRQSLDRKNTLRWKKLSFPTPMKTEFRRDSTWPNRQ